jgi:hypothetical protein
MEVVNAVERGSASERAVRSGAVVVVEPVWQGAVAVVMGAVAEAVGPLARHRLLEAFHLAVGAGPVRSRGQVADASIGEQRSERAVVDVGKALSVISRLATIPFTAIRRVRARGSR